jgi:hypothetical protein
LALINKAIFRSVHHEERRLRVRTLPFSDRRSPLRCHIQNDHAEGLEGALKLGEFDKDSTSVNGRLLHSSHGLGINLLLGLCIENRATRCFGFLINWANKPETPFSYDLMWVYEEAKTAAVRDGKLHCFMYLHDHDKEAVLGSPIPLYMALLGRVRSPTPVAWLSRRLPRETDYLPILLAQCSNKYAQPALIEVLTDLVPQARLNQPVSYSWGSANDEDITTEITALSAAAYTLHVPVINVLLRCGVPALPPYEQPPNNPPPNPLFSALTHPLPGKPTTLQSTDDPKALWETRTAHHASALHLAVFTLLTAAPATKPLVPHPHPLPHKHKHNHHNTHNNNPQDNNNPNHKAQGLTKAALLHIHTLRTALLSNLPWLLSSTSTSTRTTTTGTTSPTNPNGRNMTQTADRRWLSEVLFAPARVASSRRATAWSAFFADPVRRGQFAGAGPGVFLQGSADDCGDNGGIGRRGGVRGRHGGGRGADGRVSETRDDVTWRGGLSGVWVRGRLAEEAVGVELAKGLEKVWELLVKDLEMEKVVEAAGQFLKVREGGYKRLDKIGVLWELLVAEEREAPPSDGEAGEGEDDAAGSEEKTGDQEAVENSGSKQKTGM